MAAPPDNRKGGESTVGDAQRSTPTPFLTKTYQIVDDPSVDDVISWNEDGSTFIVWNPPEFATDLLPKYFKHNNFSSFIRQLNTYGFRKVMRDRWEFSNDFFRKGEKKLLREIQRKKIVSSTAASAVQPPSPAGPPPRQMVSPSESGEEQVISSSNSHASVCEFSGTTAELIGENERLRKVNLELNKELHKMKKLCSNIYVMMSKYASSDINERDSCEIELADNVLKPLELLPMTRYREELKIFPAEDGGKNSILRSTAEEISARLFGVLISVKRKRPDEGCSLENEMDLKLQQPGGDIQSQPLDGDQSGDDQDSSRAKRCSSIRNNSVC